MKLATIFDDSAEGKLIVISKDGKRFLIPEKISSMLEAIENWDEAEQECQILSKRLLDGGGESTSDLNFLAPLPRTWQWLDGSAFPSHGKLLQQAFKLPPLEYEKPLMYQGMSHQFYGPAIDIPFLREEDGIDFEGEIGVIVDKVPMGTSAKDAIAHIKLIVLINDWSLRTLAPIEMKTGFGWIQAKPACSMAAFAITPDEAGASWYDSRLHLDFNVDFNGMRFGSPNAGAMEVGFHELIAHAASTRTLCAGTMIGSGTVSNDDFRQTGSTCIAEKRGIEIIDKGSAITSFMKFGDQVRMQVIGLDKVSLFGAIEQCVVKQI